MKIETIGKLCEKEYEIGFLSGQLKSLLDRLLRFDRVECIDTDAFSEIALLHEKRNQCMREEITLLKAKINTHASIATLVKIDGMEQRIEAQHILLNAWQTNATQEGDRLFYFQTLSRMLAEEGQQMKEMLHFLKQALGFA